MRIEEQLRPMPSGCRLTVNGRIRRRAMRQSNKRFIKINESVVNENTHDYVVVLYTTYCVCIGAAGTCPQMEKGEKESLIVGHRGIWPWKWIRPAGALIISRLPLFRKRINRLADFIII